jgi:hypothetical protein
MATAQFEKDYRSLLRRFKRAADPKTLKLFQQIDRLARQLARKDLPDAERESSKRKIGDAPKKLKQLLKEESAEIKRDGTEAAKNVEDRSASAAAARGVRSLLYELNRTERVVTTYCTQHGKPTPPPPPKPNTDFAGDYARAMAKFSFKHSPAVLAALKKLDNAQKAEEVAAIYKAAKAELDKSLPPLETEARSADAKSKANATGALAALSKVREEMKNFDRRIFLLHRLKG